MQLRHKFSLVAFIYLLSLVANLILAICCILIYFDSAFGEFEDVLARQQLVEQIRSGVRQQASDLADRLSPAERRKLYEDSQQQIQTGLSQLLEPGSLPPDLHKAIEDAAEQKDAVATQNLKAVGPVDLSDNDRRAFRDLDHRLGEVNHLDTLEREEHVRRAAKVEQRVITILIGSAVLGAILCIIGLLGMRRWVMLPVDDLRVATEEISQGHFEHRVRPRSGDELGQLARKVNLMCATIVEMQKRLVEKERLAAAGEMVTRVAHNIRNPLSGMRVLAEATAKRVSQDQASIDNLHRIMNSIDSFERWLRDLQQSVAPLTLAPRRVDTRAMIDRVAAAVHGMLLARQIDLSVEVSPEVHWVRVDPLHFEQAVAALLTNAVQASPAGERVTLSVRPVEGRSSEWELVVEDRGPGIPPDLLERIFSAYFTTKADGTGLGLAIAQKVVRFHGGELRVESQVGHGSRFVAVVPGRLTEEDHGRHPDH